MDLTSDQQAILDLATAFGAEHVAPHARAWEAEGTIPRALWTRMSELGFGGLFAPEALGGAGLSRVEGTLVFEGLARACPTVAAFLSIHNMCAGMIAAHGSPGMQARVLPAAIRMETFLAYCLTEPGSGSDAAALRSRAERTNEGWRLTGTKAFISGGGYADAYVVMARSGEAGAGGISAFLVAAGADGLSFGALEEKMGWRAQPTRQVQLEGCTVPAEALLGEEAQGFHYAMRGLDGGRLNIAACSLGAAEAAFERTLGYVAERRAFGRRLDEFQALQFKLADCAINLEASRVLLRQAAAKLDAGAADATQACAIAKVFVTERACEVADICLQLHGGYGYLADYGIEKVVRDLRVHRILEGTSEIMRTIVARGLLSR